MTLHLLKGGVNVHEIAISIQFLGVCVILAALMPILSARFDKEKETKP